MKIIRFIIGCGWGFCFGSSIPKFFRGDINTGLGVLTIGLLLAIIWIALWIEGEH